MPSPKFVRRSHEEYVADRKTSKKIQTLQNKAYKNLIDALDNLDDAIKLMGDNEAIWNLEVVEGHIKSGVERLETFDRKHGIVR